MFLEAGIAKTPMTILETHCMQSTASAAGYATGGTMVSAIAALLMLSVTPGDPRGEHLPWISLASRTLFLGLLGTVMAIPMKRNMVNHEKLKFPSGTAAAVTLQPLCSEGSEGSQAITKARALMWSALAGAIFPLVIEPQLLSKTVVDEATGAATKAREALLPAESKLSDLLGLPVRGTHLEDGAVVQNKPSDWTMVIDHNPVMFAAGAIVGLRVTIYMLLSSLALIYVAGPAGYDAEWVDANGDEMRAASQPWTAWKEIGIWLGVPIMVSHGLLSFALQWNAIVRAFKGIGGGGASESPLVQRTEVPFSADRKFHRGFVSARRVQGERAAGVRRADEGWGGRCCCREQRSGGACEGRLVGVPRAMTGCR